MIGTSDGKQFEDEWEHLISQLTPKQRIDDTFSATKDAIDQGIMDTQGRNNIDPKLFNKDKSPGKQSVGDTGLGSEEDVKWFDTLKSDYKINPKAWDDYMAAGPWSTNIDNRKSETGQAHLELNKLIQESGRIYSEHSIDSPVAKEFQERFKDFLSRNEHLKRSINLADPDYSPNKDSQLAKDAGINDIDVVDKILKDMNNNQPQRITSKKTTLSLNDKSLIEIPNPPWGRW